MDPQEQQKQEQAFAEIFAQQGIKLSQFLKACEDMQCMVLIDFIRTLHRFVSLREKPGRPNPIAHFSPKESNLYFSALSGLKTKFEFTAYELELQEIIDICKTQSGLQLPKSLTKIQEARTFKLDEILDNPDILNEKFPNLKGLYDFILDYILSQAGTKILGINDHTARYEVVLKSLNLCSRLLHPTKLEIQISKNTLIETRTFTAIYQNEFHSKQKRFIKKAALIINEALLCPSDMRIQGVLLRVLKRMYWMWGQQITGPLFLSLRNISLYSDQSDLSQKIVKEASIFCYKIIQNKSDIKFGDILDNCEELVFLKENEYYSSKGLAFPDEIGEIYDTINLQLPFWVYRRRIQARETWVLPVIVEKPNSMLSWKFWVQGYDINFGLFKVSKCRKYTIDEYDKQRECKQLQKMVKHTQNSGKQATKGHIFLKNGLYHLVFDNSFSMVRVKDLFFQVTCMTCLT